MRLSLFPRNKVQQVLFSKIASRLVDAGYSTFLLYPKFGVSSLNDFYPELEASKIIESNSVCFHSEFKRICRTYKNINRIIQSDRELNYFPQYFGDVPVSRDLKIKLCVAFFLVFENYVREIRPQIVVSEMVIGLMDGAFFEVCQKNKICYLGIRPSKTGEGIVFCDTPFDTPIGIFNRIKDIDLNPDKLILLAKLIADSSVEKNKLPHYMVRSSRKFNIYSSRAFTAAFRVMFSSQKLPRFSVYQHKKLNAFREAIFKYLNIKRWNFEDGLYSRDSFTESYFVYAAHFEPEASVQVRAFDFSDQLGLIKLISRSLPPTSVLLVKEHRGNQGFRKPSFYKELSHLHNVRIINPRQNLRNLVQSSAGVITMTGRIGLESLIDNIPVIAFGSTFWTHLDSVYKPTSVIQLKSILKNLHDSSVVHHPKTNFDALSNDFDLAKLLIAYEECIYKGLFIQGSNYFTSDNNADDYFEAITDIISRNS